MVNPANGRAPVNGAGRRSSFVGSHSGRHSIVEPTNDRGFGAPRDGFGTPRARFAAPRDGGRGPIAVPHTRRRTRSGWNWLLVLPIVLPLLTPLYNRIGPELWGIPFFYWYQVGCALMATVVMTTVYLATKERN
jgi:hypothetical protein